MHELQSETLEDDNLGTDDSNINTVQYSYSSPYYYPRCEESLQVQVTYRPEGDSAACTVDYNFNNFLQGK